MSKRLGVEFLFGHGLFSSEEHDAINTACGDYKKTPNQPCDAAISAAHSTIGNVNVYDIYSQCITAMYDDDVNGSFTTPATHFRAPLDASTSSLLSRAGLGGPDGCINAGAATLYLNNPTVQDAIHVSVAEKKWHICGTVYLFSFYCMTTYFTIIIR